MKRTKIIDLQKMRKAQPVSLALVSTLLFTACGDSNEREAVVYRNKTECIKENPDQSEQCQQAYNAALKEAESSAPKYESRHSCESEFGYNRCVRSSQNNWFMPALGGFMLARALNNNYYNSNRYDYARSTPVYYHNNSWVGGNGTRYGSTYNRTTTVPEKAFNPKPRVTKTISRGGFGSTAQAKSSWGGSWGSKGRSYGG